MRPRVVVLGGGTGGTLVANRLRRRFPADELEVTVVDQDDRHVYQPGLLFMPFGRQRTDRLVRSRRRQLAGGIELRRSAVDHVDIEARQVHLADGGVLAYDALVIATGAVVAPEETDGLTGPGWMDRVFTFYTPEGASALAGSATAPASCSPTVGCTS